MHRAHLLVALLVLGVGGCIFQHYSPQERLTEQVYAYNDETRWARIDLAADRVSPDYRATFLASHAAWGTHVQIADTDLTNVIFTEGGHDEATSLVSVSWYDQRTMLVTASVVSQRWRSTDNGFLLVGESVVSGDEGLLDLPAVEDAPTPTSGGEQTLAAR